MPGEEATKAMGGFGGGFGGTGNICGALVGALGVMGLRFSRSRVEEKEDPRIWSYTQMLNQKFAEEIVGNHPSIHCRDIARVNWTDQGEVEKFYVDSERLMECLRIVSDTALLVAGILKEISI